MHRKNRQTDRSIHRSSLFLVLAGIFCFSGSAAWGRTNSLNPLTDILARSYQHSTVKTIIGHSAKSAKSKKQRPELHTPAFLDAGKWKRIERYQPLIERYGKVHGLDAGLVKAVIYVESGGHPQAVSPKGAGGLMQLMPGTAADLKVEDLFDPEQNIASGTRYLSSLLDRFKSTELALWAYNAGPQAVQQDRMPRETQQYVPQVLRVVRYLKTQSEN